MSDAIAFWIVFPVLVFVLMGIAIQFYGWLLDNPGFLLLVFLTVFLWAVWELLV